MANSGEINAPVRDDREIGWCEFSQKMKPQSNAMSGGIFLMLSSGMHLGWGLVLANVLISPWTYGFSKELVYFALVIYFIAAIAGFLLAPFMYGKYATRNIYLLPNICVGVSGFLFLVLPNSYYAILFGRLFAGFGHGLAYVTVITHGSELLTPRIRGMALASIHFCVISGVFVLGAFGLAYPPWNTGAFFNTNSTIGLLSLIYSVMAIAYVPFFTKESPVWYLKRKQERDALLTMIRLHSESQETWSIRNEFNELKMMVSEDENTSSGIFDDGNMKPLILILLMRLGQVLSFNFLLNLMRYQSTILFVDFTSNFTLIAAFGMRFSAAFIAIFIIDAVGRRKLFTISSGCASLTLFLYGIFFEIYMDSTINGIFLMIYEFFCGLGIGLTTDVYSGEAFNSIKKAKSIAFTSILEYFLQIIIIIIAVYIPMTKTTFTAWSITTAIIMLMNTIYLYNKLPETAKMSIRQTRSEFLKSGVLIYSGGKTTQGGLTFT